MPVRRDRVTPLNWRIKAEDLDFCLADADAAAIVFDDVARDTVAGAAVSQRLLRIAIGEIDGATCRFEDLGGGANGFAPRAGPDDLSLAAVQASIYVINRSD